MVLGYGLSLVTQGAAFITWWRVVFTGRQSATMHDALKVGLAYQVRSLGFLLLLTETHPRLLDLPDQSYPADAPALPAPAGAARVGSAIPLPATPEQKPPADPGA